MDSYAVRWDVLREVFVVSSSCKMPSDIVSVVVTTGVGVSVLAGLLSGVCYILAQTRSSRKPASEWHCSVCGTHLRSIDGILNGDKSVICSKCQKQVCKSQCSSFTQQVGWVCTNCLRPTESWFQGLLNVIQPNNQKANWMGAMNLPPSVPPTNARAADGDAKKSEKERVRDFLERLVNVMLGEDVDDATVTKLYNDKLYLPVTGQSPCTAHAALKQIIERLLRDSGALPHLSNPEERSGTPSDQSDRTYEDLLATAIINKVVSSSQNNIPTSSRASVSSRLSNSSRNPDKEYFFGEETLDSKWKTTDLETSSVSSLEDWIHSDSSFGSRKYVDKVTLTIKQDIEEVSQSDSEDDIEYFRSKSSLLSDDESNWFLQKRQFHGTNSPVPVPMLIPNPTTDAKVLIGDKEIDETSDLSDIASDFEEPELVPTRQTILVESKTIIGGKNHLHTTGSESESSADSGVKEVDGTDKSGYDAADDADRGEARADITVDDDNVEDASILSVYSNTEQEAEYTERYASLPRTMLKSPTPAKRTSVQRFRVSEKKSQEIGIHKATNEEDDINDEIDPFSGSYSRREKEKWKHAIHMENNPYSKENIEKRIKRSSSSVSSLFGSDYYARQASSPAGSKSSQGVSGITWPPPQPPKEEEVQEVQIVLSDESLMNSSSNNNSVELTQDDDVFDATVDNPRPVLLAATPFPRPDASYSDTSDTDLSCTHYYDVEHSKVYKKTANEINNESSETSLSIDENSNLTTTQDQNKFQKNETQSTTKERPTYLKLNSVNKPRSIQKPPEGTMRRHKSESDLLDDIDLRPKVMQRKRDNTLISKIYSNPQVRQFALSSRNQLPIDEPTFTSFSGKPNVNRSYNSDDGLARSPGAFYGSHDDLLSSKINAPTASASNHQIRKPNYSFSSEDDILSETGSAYAETPKSTKLSTHGSSENLLGSTLGENQRVRTPETFLSSSRTPGSEDSLLSQDARLASRPKSLLLGRAPRLGERTPSPDIEELVKKKIVASILDQMEKPHSEDIVKKDAIEDEEQTAHISVKDLRKRFENNDATSRVVSSLTARSLSKQMREDLKH